MLKHVSIFMSIHMFKHVSIFMSIHMLKHVSIFMSIHMSTHMSVHKPIEPGFFGQPVVRLSSESELWASSGHEATSKESRSKESYPDATYDARGSPSVPMWLSKASQLVCTLSTSDLVMCSLCHVINDYPHHTVHMSMYMSIHMSIQLYIQVLT